MKEAIFVRHAKSDWGNETLQDADRHLSERGYGDAYFISAWHAREHAAPELLVSSPAVRAFSTALVFARAHRMRSQDIVIIDDIYEARQETLLQVLRATDDRYSRVAFFGHNPGFTNVCNELSDEMFFDNVPTCGVVALDFSCKRWREIAPHTGRLAYYQFPKDFKNSTAS